MMPHLCKGEDLVRNDFETSSVHFPGALHILSLQLLKQGVVDPKVDVPLPVPLFWRRRDVCNCPLIDLQHPCMLRTVALRPQLNFMHCIHNMPGSLFLSSKQAFATCNLPLVAQAQSTAVPGGQGNIEHAVVPPTSLTLS